MVNEIIPCPHCGARVIFKPSGGCPACGHTPVAVDVDIVSSTGESQQAKASAEEPLERPASRLIAEIIFAESDFLELRDEATRLLGLGKSPDLRFASRIESELLPTFDRAVERLDLEPEYARPHREEFLQARRESWRHLAEAIRRQDPAALKRHEAMWSQSSQHLALASAEEKTGGSPRVLSPLRQFEHDLSAHAPRIVATPVLIAANVLVYLAMVASGTDFLDPDILSLIEWGGDYAPYTMNGQWWRLVTATFIHGGLIHLAMNMWALWDLGRLVERLVGAWGFVIVYFAAGIAGSIASVAFHPFTVCVGASGAVFGVGGALLGLLVRQPHAFPPHVLQHLRNSMAAFLGYNILYGLQSANIDMAAHLGGLAAGFGFGLILSQPKSPAPSTSRTGRNALLLGTAAVLLPLLAALAPAPQNVERALLELAEVEETVFARFDALAGQADLSNADFESALRNDVLAPWQEMRKSLESLAALPYLERSYLQRVLAYATKREEGWSLQIEGVHENDDAKLQQATKLSEDADKLAEGLNEP